MTDRGIATVVGSALLALVIAGLLAVGAMSGSEQRRGDARTRIFFGDRPPAVRTVEQVQARVPLVVRPLVPVQREVAGGAREAAGYVLLLIGVTAALVFAREQVVASYRASLGGWRAIARVWMLGLALLALIASATFLLAVVLLGSFVSGEGTFARAAFGSLAAAALLTAILVAAVAIVVGMVALVGSSGAFWRLGDAILSVPALARFGRAAPPAFVAGLGATVVYLLAQAPVIGRPVAILALAYAIGSVAAARLGHAPRPSPG